MSVHLFVIELDLNDDVIEEQRAWAKTGKSFGTTPIPDPNSWGWKELVRSDSEAIVSEAIIVAHREYL